MKKRNYRERSSSQRKAEKRKKGMVIGITAGMFLILGILGVLWYRSMVEATMALEQGRQVQNITVEEILSQTEDSDGDKEISEQAKEEVKEGKASEDAQRVQQATESQGTVVTANEIQKAVNETSDLALGIDVAKYQGTIDWKQVKDAGISFAMVRIGYRMSKSGTICEDANAKYNLQQAKANGIKLGAYFFSTAVTEAEAKEEADYVADFVAQYPITYPIAYNCEGFLDSENRNSTLSNEERTKVALAFLKEIQARGYTPMFYSSKNEMEQNRYWNMDQISGSYKVWVSQYPTAPFPQTPKSSYSGAHAMWQYTSQGSIPGISKPVDVNVAYFGYTQEAKAQNETEPEAVAADVEALMTFTAINDTVTAKNVTNLRSEPSTTGNTVVATLNKGVTAQRTGICEAAGWSRITYQGQTLYAVSSFLTTDLTVKQETTQATSAGGESAATATSENTTATTTTVVDGVEIKTTFMTVEDKVTAKDLVNLRSLPSVTNPAVKVVGTLNAGDVARRTGINYEYGWSRLEYNGQTVYAVTSYLNVTQ